MEFLNNYTMQSVYFCNLKRELGCILACVDEIGEETCHAELARVSRGWNAFAKVDKTILQNVELPFNANEQDISASDQRRMDKFSVSRHCECSEAIRENGDLFRLLRRFTPRNDNKKVGVECQ